MAKSSKNLSERLHATLDHSYEELYIGELDGDQKTLVYLTHEETVELAKFFEYLSSKPTLYLAFSGEDYQSIGGFSEFIGAYKSLQEAIAALEGKVDTTHGPPVYHLFDRYKWAHVAIIRGDKISYCTARPMPGERTVHGHIGWAWQAQDVLNDKRIGESWDANGRYLFVMPIIGQDNIVHITPYPRPKE